MLGGFGGAAFADLDDRKAANGAAAAVATRVRREIFAMVVSPSGCAGVALLFHAAHLIIPTDEPLPQLDLD